MYFKYRPRLQIFREKKNHIRVLKYIMYVRLVPTNYECIHAKRNLVIKQLLSYSFKTLNYFFHDHSHVIQ